MRCECETEAIEHEFIIVFSSKTYEMDGESYICKLMEWFNEHTEIRILNGSWLRVTTESVDEPSTTRVVSEIKMRVVSDTHNIVEERELLEAKLRQSYLLFARKYYPENPLEHDQIVNIGFTVREIK